jgi:hypothetical protein
MPPVELRRMLKDVEHALGTAGPPTEDMVDLLLDAFCTVRRPPRSI